MVETYEQTAELESSTVGVYRTAATIKGGRRFSFSSLVVVGDRNGRVSFGYGKANQVPPAIEKAQKQAKRSLKRYPLTGRTIPHAVTGRFGACQVRLIPASPGTGVIASHAVRATLEVLGVQDCLTKSLGSHNEKNLVKAVIDGLEQLRSKEMIEELRGVELGKTAVEEALERGQAFMPAMPTPTKKTEQSDNKSDRKGDGKKRGKKRGGRGRKGGRGGAPGKPEGASEARADDSKQKQPPQAQDENQAATPAPAEPPAEKNETKNEKDTQ